MRAGLALVAALLAAPAAAQTAADEHAVSEAALVRPTDRYGHDVLGGTPAWGALALTYKHCARCRGLDLRTVVVRLPESRVFEDVEARVVDVDGDGLREVLVVETDLDLGASLAVYGPRGRIAATGFIGAPHRWLAPAGVADFDGDGKPEVAYVDRPHLARELVFVRRDGARLVEIARAPGYSNHRIGERAIASAVRDCGRAELLLPDLDRTRLLAVRLEGSRVVARDAGPWDGGRSLTRAARC